MKKLLMITLLGSSLLTTNMAVAEEVLAKFSNGQTITKKEVDEKIKTMFGGSLPDGKKDFSELPKEVKENFLKNIVVTKLVAKEVDKAKIKDREDFKNQLKEVEAQISGNMLLTDIANKAVNDAKVKETYDKIAKDYAAKQEIRARHILVKTEKEANEIIAELKKGTSFESLAKKKSLDGTKEKGGDLGYFVPDMMVKEFSDAALALKPGEYTKKPVQTEFGWHVIKVEDKRAAKVPPFQEAKPGIEQDLKQQAVREYIDKLVADAKPEYMVQ